MLSAIDMFCGAGGLSAGFHSQGFRTLWANDIEEPALATFSANNPWAKVDPRPVQEIPAASVRSLLGLKAGELDIVLGGPPCQGFSTYGKRDSEDHRNGLYEFFFAFVDEFRPRAFVMENVVGILSMDDGRIIDDARRRAHALGYMTNCFVLDAASYGVPQFRKRVFLCGLPGRVIEAPPTTHETSEDGRGGQQVLALGGPALPPPISVRDAISDLPDDVLPPARTQESMPYPPRRRLTPFQDAMREGADALRHHSAKRMLGIRRLRLALLNPGDYGTRIRARVEEGHLPESLIDELLGEGKYIRDLDECRTEDRAKERALRELLASKAVSVNKIMAFLDSGGFANKYRRLEWDKPSHTLVAHMARDCSDFVHPDIDRFVSVREAARLQSFPDAYRFPGSQFQQFRQIGNAVPPKLAAAVAGAVTAALLRGRSHSASRTRLVASSTGA